MIDAEDSGILRQMIPASSLAVVGTEGRFRDLSARALSPERPGLRVARQVIADVLFALEPHTVKRFEARGVMYFDMGAPAVQADATREAWESACGRLDLPWVGDGTRRFLDRVARSWQTRDGDRVRVHRQGSGGTVESTTVREEELLQAEDPGTLIRALSSRPLELEQPATLSDVVSLTSAHTAVVRAEALAWEAVHGSSRGTRPPARVVWTVEDRGRLTASKQSRLLALYRGVAAMQAWARTTGAWQRFQPSAPDPYEAVISIYETGMLLEAITPEWIWLVCPTTS